MRFMLSHVHACSYLRYELCFSVLLQYGTILSQAWIGPGFYWICIECCFSTCLETALTLSKRGCQKHYADNESLAMWAHVSMQSIWSIRKYFTNCCIQESRSYNNTCTHDFFLFSTIGVAISCIALYLWTKDTTAFWQKSYLSMGPSSTGPTNANCFEIELAHFKTATIDDNSKNKWHSDRMTR